jgi:hypothetical protein
MKIKKFNTITGALFGSTKKDKTYSFVWHRLKKGECIREHYHNEANEWLIAAGGGLSVTIGRETRQFFSKGAAIVVFLPKKKKHSLIALTTVSYFVIRDKDDRVIYTKKQAPARA